MFVSRACASPSRVSQFNVPEVLAELPGCRLHISGEEEKPRGRAGVRCPSAFCFHLFLSCFLFCTRALDAGLPFSRPGFRAQTAQAGMCALVRGGMSSNNFSSTRTDTRGRSTRILRRNPETAYATLYYLPLFWTIPSLPMTPNSFAIHLRLLLKQHQTLLANCRTRSMAALPKVGWIFRRRTLTRFALSRTVYSFPMSLRSIKRPPTSKVKP
ncbi:hypothetical protein B0H13DRAFT_881525 [Mycena leptocephala]|nr:hypothetical protein B0H13DRAFT_881525 [Mycena leptocephala]